MKKLTIFFGILLVSFSSFGQYTTDKTPANLTKTTTLSAADWLVVEKSTDNYVKAITAYDSYVYYRRCLDSIINLNVSGDLNVVDRIDAFRIYADIIQATNLAASSNFVCSGDSYFTDMVNIQDTLYAYVMKMLPLDTISSSYCLALDPTDSVIKLAPMDAGTGGKLLLSNVVHVDYTASTNDTVLRIFKNYADAITYINTQTAPTDTTRWTVIMPSGYCNEAIIFYENIAIMGVTGTLLRSVVSDMNYCAYTGISVNNCSIDTLYISQGNLLAVDNCIVYNITPVSGDGDGWLKLNNSTVLGGDFDNTLGNCGWLNNIFVATKSNIENLTNITTPFVNCVFYSVPDYANFAIIELPNDIYGGYGNIHQLVTMPSKVKWSNFNLESSDSLIFEKGGVITNSYIAIDTIIISGGEYKVYNSVIAGTKILNDTCTIEVHNSTLSDGDLVLNDTAILKLYYGAEIDGTITLNDDATKIDEVGVYAEIYYADASTAQSIPTGTTYTKWTAFTTDGESNNCTADAANDKITITEAGTYFVQGNFSTSCGTDSVTASKALFVGGSEVNKIHKLCMFSTQTNAQEGSISGLIKVTDAQVPVDIDVRIRHDNVSDVNFTGIYGNLTVYKIAY
jgi:hypothetical protein